jgi:hypothetical protein
MIGKTAPLLWRAKNVSTAFPPPPPPHAPLAKLANDLRRDGITSSDVGTVFADTALVARAHSRALQLREHHGPPSGDGPKGYLAHLLEDEIAGDDPFFALALHPNVLSVVNRYLGLRSIIRAVNLWLTRPTSGPSVDTQLWHRDGDDVMNVKMYVYFSDVTVAAGPLAYAVGTHPIGRNRAKPTARDAAGRSTDDEMTGVLRGGPRVCDGPGGSVFFADTCGFHKQLKPTEGERLLMMAQYTSATPRFPTTFRLSMPPTAALTKDQRAALGPSA